MHSSLWTAQPFPLVFVRFHDQYGNLVPDSRSITFTKAGAPTSTGTITLTTLGTVGVYSTGGTLFWRAGAYTLSVSGISAANTLGVSTFYVKPDTALPLFLTVITPQSLTAGDSATHPWTLTLTGDNFNPSAVAYQNLTNLVFPTTFVSATGLQVRVPENMRQFGTYMLLVKTASPPKISAMLPFVVIDNNSSIPSLPLIQATTVVVSGEEQTILSQMTQNPSMVAITSVRIAPVSQILTAERLEIGIANN